MKSALSQWITKAWYKDAAWLKLLRPLSCLFGTLARRKRARFLAHKNDSYHASAAIIVIGNITAGGTGKTPLTLALAALLQKHDVKVAIVSRGYGGNSSNYPLEVQLDTDAALCGDEALIYAARAACPVVVDPDRVRAVKYLEEHYKPRLILSDDGLQHYALAREIEIVVIDGQRGLGNKQFLPQGPLRESSERLHSVDFVMVNGELESWLPELKVPVFNLFLKPGLLHNLRSGESLTCTEFQQRYPGKVHAVAGIGNPERFFSTLTALGFAIITQVFTDHHRYKAADISFKDSWPVIMTEKDAVKCRTFAAAEHWYLRVDAQLPEGFMPLLLDQLVAKKTAAVAPAVKN